MDPRMKELIDDVKEVSLTDGVFTRDMILALLKLDPKSEECDYLGIAARDVARVRGKNRGGVSTSIGIDLVPCSMSCRFCSLGEKWGLVKESCMLPDERIVKIVREKFNDGFKQFILRTTEFFDIDTLCKLGQKVRKEVPGQYVLTANTGELTLEQAQKLKQSGFNGAYHALRLREGVDTPIDPEVRISTMKAIKDAGLQLGSGVDPIGIEHTDEELADLMMFYTEIKPMGLCTMRRINVEGTPMEGIPEVDDDRMAQLAAIIRLIQGERNVIVQPPILKAMQYGANAIAIETGANPRYNEHDDDVWTVIGHDEAVAIVKAAQYDLV